MSKIAYPSERDMILMSYEHVLKLWNEDVIEENNEFVIASNQNYTIRLTEFGTITIIYPEKTEIENYQPRLILFADCLKAGTLLNQIDLYTSNHYIGSITIN